MRKIFIDCGACKGHNIERFLKKFEDADKYEIFAFECFPKNVADIKKNYGDKCTLIEAAVSDTDKYQTFRIGQTRKSGSLRTDKNSWMTSDTVQVKCINFSQWVKENFSEDDYIIASWDIEGAEYDILESMKNNDTLKYFNKFYIEFHGAKLDKFDIKVENNWIKYLKEFFNENVYIHAYNNHYQLDKFKILNES